MISDLTKTSQLNPTYGIVRHPHTPVLEARAEEYSEELCAIDHPITVLIEVAHGRPQLLLVKLMSENSN